MIKKTAIAILILAALVISAINVNAYDTTMTINDEINDVILEDSEGNLLENYSHPNVDIDELKCVQTGKNVEITFKVHDDGKIENSINVYYMITLVTTDEDGVYMIVYNSDILGEVGGTDPILIMGGKGDMISPTSFSGLDTNTLSVSFNLMTNNEKLISIGALAIKQVDDVTSYADAIPDDFNDMSFGMNIYPDAGGSYELNVGETLQLSGTLSEGDPSDYNWLWLIDDTSIAIEGQNPTQEFKTKKAYTGRLYVYDGQGNWGMDYFEIDVSANNSGTGGNGGNNQPGFELILVVAAVAIALLIFRKKKK
jgi:hypothetical protein